MSEPIKLKRKRNPALMSATDMTRLARAALKARLAHEAESHARLQAVLMKIVTGYPA